MISSYRAGYNAGSTASQQYSALTAEARATAAQEELARRKALGIAHIYPEEEFIKGFLDGCHAPAPIIDGLTLYMQQSDKSA